MLTLWSAPRPARSPVTERRRQHVEGALADGVAASPGVATGPVRVLATPDAEAFQDGGVLVVELADPGWTPLFPRLVVRLPSQHSSLSDRCRTDGTL